MTPPPNLAQQSARFDLQRALRKMRDTHEREAARESVLEEVEAVFPELVPETPPEVEIDR